MSDIYASSRYHNQVIDYIQIKPGGNITPNVFYQFDDLYNKTFTLYAFKQGDKLYQLSYRFFGRPDMWWAIAEMNPEVQDFTRIQPGTLLRIPSV